MNLKSAPTPEDLYKRIVHDNIEKSEADIIALWLEEIRKVTRTVKKCTSEDYWFPSEDSLKLHWQRCCYVVQIWNQSDKTNILYPPISEWGSSYVDDKLIFK